MLPPQPRAECFVRLRLCARGRAARGSGGGKTRFPGQAVPAVRLAAQREGGIGGRHGGSSVAGASRVSISSMERREVVMSLLTGFFKESDTQLGVFYPKHYLIAVFRDSRAAQRAVQELWATGFARDEAIAVEGQEFVDLANEETGPGNFVMQALSRFFGTEQKTHDADLQRAQHGAGFVAVHCVTDECKQQAWARLQPHGPLAARYYCTAGIEHLAGDFATN